jgi:hypothetical protein
LESPRAVIDAAPAQHRKSVAPIVAFVIRYTLGCLLLWISSIATRLARKVAPTS